MHLIVFNFVIIVTT